MENGQLQLDPIAIAQSLARIEEQNATMIKNWENLQQNLALGPGSPLRDSVQREIQGTMKEQHKQCGVDMRAVAETFAGQAVKNHEEKHHKTKRDSRSPDRHPVVINLGAFKPLALLIVRWLLPAVLGGGVALGGMEAMSDKQPPPRSAVQQIDSDTESGR
jgi:hypothetical protein